MPQQVRGVDSESGRAGGVTARDKGVRRSSRLEISIAGACRRRRGQAAAARVHLFAGMLRVPAHPGGGRCPSVGGTHLLISRDPAETAAGRLQ